WKFAGRGNPLRGQRGRCDDRHSPVRRAGDFDVRLDIEVAGEMGKTRWLMRWLALALICVSTISVSSQEAGWCGYALISGLPLLANQLAPLEAITPDKGPGVNPFMLFQYRFSLDHSQVIIEGCWKVAPTREVVITLLSQTVTYDSKVMAAQVDQQVQQAV